MLGGSRAVNTATARSAGAYGQRVTRLAGGDRFETAQSVAEQYPAGTRSVVVASGAAYPDALVGAALAGHRGAPLLLTERDGIPPVTGQALDRLALHRADAVGGTGVIGERVLNLLGAYLD